MKELITYPLNDVDYSAEDAGLFHCTRKSGVWYEDSFPIEVSGADNTIFIGKGLAWFSNTEFWGKVAAQKTKVSLDLEYADPAYDRIDVIALQFDANKNATNLIVKKGEAKTNPTIPSISRTEAVYELYLYAITRPAASLTVTSENVRDLRLDDAYCGLMADSVTSLDFPVVPVEKGGTGAASAAEALKNLGITTASGELDTKILPSSGVTEGTYGGLNTETGVYKVPNVTVDEYGRVTSANEFEAPKAEFKLLFNISDTSMGAQSFDLGGEYDLVYIKYKTSDSQAFPIAHHTILAPVVEEYSTGPGSTDTRIHDEAVIENEHGTRRIAYTDGVINIYTNKLDGTVANNKNVIKRIYGIKFN